MQQGKGYNIWIHVGDKEFSPIEVRQAADFADMLEAYSFPDEELLEVYNEHKEMNLGQKLVLAVKVPVAHLDELLLGEDDERLTAIIKKRMSGESLETNRCEK